ncbi:MAG: M20/M25/M40 family metallo-hydrolase [Gemmatimonadales bacterium]|nr:MAG: M20/M25/M40 family metallo-hydrolase [Gemmatimonadales bacterium]
MHRPRLASSRLRTRPSGPGLAAPARTLALTAVAALLLPVTGLPGSGEVDGVRGLPGVGALNAQTFPHPELHEAYFAWDEGDYVRSMEAYLAALRGPRGQELVREAAMLTGEVHPVRELDDDGRNLQVAPDSRWLAWSRQVDGAWQTHVELVEGGDRQTFETNAVVLGPEGLAGVLDPGGLRVVGLAEGTETTVELEGRRPHSMAFRPDAAELWIAAGEPDSDRTVLLRAQAPEWVPRAVELDAPVVVNPRPLNGGEVVLFQVPQSSPFAGQVDNPTSTGGPAQGFLEVGSGRNFTVPGGSASAARDGSYVAFLRTDFEDGAHIVGASMVGGIPASADDFTILVDPDLRIGDPAVSPDGSTLAYKAMPHWTWEVFTVPTDGSADTSPGRVATPREGITRVTREAQHDQFPAWVDDERLVTLKGEFRHRRSVLHDLSTGDREYRLFHSNTLRTISPEYEWVVAPDASGILVTAERDGNTIDPRRAVYWIDLEGQVGMDELEARLEANLEHERELLAEGEATFAPIADEVRAATSEISVGRVFHYADIMYRMGSKFVGLSGNDEATEFLRETLESWGYEVELQYWDLNTPRAPSGLRVANVVARLPGTENPELVYIISSHFDSVLPAPGADDNTSGTTAMLEAARVLAERPRKASVEFVLLNAEEVGLVGAREYVRMAEEDGKNVVGVLNNDMIGWTRSHRLDNTIRHSNHGIMRIQHGAAHHFSDLITYNALYTRGTDGQVFYDVWGDIVGGIGSYPVLGNPHYHQRTDKLETINHQLVAEVSRTTAATIMLLADSPIPVAGLQVTEQGGGEATLAWEANPETGIEGYQIHVVSEDGSVREVDTVTETGATVTGVSAGDRIEVRAVRENGLRSWDASSVVVD